MSDYSALKATIDANITDNGVGAITGPVLNEVLNEMVDVLGDGGGANLTGYVSVASVADLPEVGEPTLGYLIGTDLYLYVGEGGDTLDGKYQNCGPFRGPSGANGANGSAGKSAYQIWLDEGNVGTEEEFLDSLQGNSGYTGAAGELEIVNNLTDGGAAKALSASAGKYLNSKVFGGTIDVIKTQADADEIVQTYNGSVVSSNGNRVRVIIHVKVGDAIKMSMSLGQGCVGSIYSTIADCYMASTNYLQTLQYSYTTSVIEGVSEYDGYLCVSLAKTGNARFTAAEVTTYVNALVLSIDTTEPEDGAIPAINEAIYGEETTELQTLTLADADVAYTNNGAEVSSVTSANRLHLIYQIPAGASINISCEINSGVAVALYDTRAKALNAGTNWLESYTSGGYATSVEATSAYAGYLNLNYKNASGGTLSQQDYTDFMAVVSVLITYYAEVTGAGIISRLNKLESSMVNADGNLLYVGKVLQGSRGTQDISSSNASVTMNTLAVPFANAKFKAYLPSGIVADIRTGTTSQTLSNIATIEDGDVFQFADNITYYCLNFRKADGSGISADEVQSMIDGNGMYFPIVNGDGTTPAERNSYNEPYALAPMRKGVLTGYGTYLSIAHASDFHSDAVRVKNFFDLCNHYGVKYAVHTGDVVGWPYNGFEHFVELSKTFIGKTINCNGNHDVFGTSQSTIFANNIKPFTDALGITTDKCYYYYDDTTYKVRFIVLDVFENALSNGNNQADITGTQMNWLISTLASVPADYGVILCYHTPADAILSNNLGFYQETTSYYTTLDNYGQGVKNAPIQKIVNAFIRRESISGTYTSHGTSYSYSANFTSVPSSAEFICHMTGHEHSDRIGYYTGYDGNTSGQNKQLVFNISCGNAMYGNGYQYLAHLSDMPRGGKGLVQDAINVMTFFRNTKQIQVTRLGGFVTSDGDVRLAALFDYA